jgi:hypothetical protein
MYSSEFTSIPAEPLVVSYLRGTNTGPIDRNQRTPKANGERFEIRRQQEEAIASPRNFTIDSESLLAPKDSLEFSSVAPADLFVESERQ